MALSLAQMRESGAVGLPERTIRLCLAQKLIAEIEAIEMEIGDLRDAPVEDDAPKRPRRNGDPNAARITELTEKVKALGEQMADHTGELTLRGIPAGEWRRWADANPARSTQKDAKGEPIIDAIDARHAFGYCNAAALLDSLDTFAVAWDGQPLGPGDWEFIASKAAPGDLAAICREVVAMHEATGGLPKLLKPSPSTQSGATG